jgi:hypothetical protein
MANPEQGDRVQEQPPRAPERSTINETQDYQKSNPAMFRADQTANDKLVNSGALPAISFGQFDGRYDSAKMMGQQNGFKFEDGMKAYEGGHSLTNGIMLTRENASRVATRELEPGSPALRGNETQRGVEQQGKSENNSAALTSKLMDAKATPQERLAAARELVNSGVTKIDTTMQDGSKASLRLDSTKAGSKEMVHVFVNKGNRENVALRGNFDESGALSKQQNNGKTYSYEGKGQRDLSRMSFTCTLAPRATGAKTTRQKLLKSSACRKSAPAPQAQIHS